MTTNQGNITLSDIVSLQEYVNPFSYITHSTHHPQSWKIRWFAWGYVGYCEVFGSNHRKIFLYLTTFNLVSLVRWLAV